MVRRLLPLAVVVACSTSCSSDPSVEVSPRVQTSAALKHFSSCAELTTRLRANLEEEARTSLVTYLDARHTRWGFAEDTASNDAAPPSAAGAGASAPREGTDYSGTNNQEAGVDEADFVKTDGNHIYVLNSQALYVIAVPTFGQLQEVTHLDLEGYPSAMLVADDTVVVLSTVYPRFVKNDLIGRLTGPTTSSFRTQTLTKLTVVDVSDRANPSVARELYIEGYYQTARRIGSSIRVVSYANIDTSDVYFYPKLDDYGNVRNYEAAAKKAVPATIALNASTIANKPLSDFVPALYERVGGAIVEHDFTDEQCANFAMADDSFSHGVASISSFNLDELKVETDHIVTNEGVVYASADTLLIAEPAFNPWWYYGQDAQDDATNVHRFDIATPGVTTYTGSGRVAGRVNSQFNLSVVDGVVRLASTSNLWGRWWESNPPPVSSNVFTLAGEAALEVQGSITGIEEGEQLWGTRFVGDRGYIVTFRNTDPLFVIDLADPKNPRMLGELKVPGVSTYVHPLDGGRLLSIGLGGDDTRIDWGTTQVSLFDVTNDADPRLAASLPLRVEGDWSWSEALYEHKAFTYWAPKSLLAVPLSTYSYRSNYYRYVSSLELISVGPDTLARSISIDHAPYFNDSNTWYSDSSIRRSIFMGEYVIAVSDRAVTASALANGDTSAIVRLPGKPDYYGYEGVGFAD